MTPLDNYRPMIQEHLAQLLRCKSDAFMVITDTMTDHFVQFARFEDGLLFDVPLLEASQEILMRAELFFNHRHANHQGQIYNIQIFPINLHYATELVLQSFAQIFLLDSVALSIEIEDCIL